MLATLRATLARLLQRAANRTLSFCLRRRRRKQKRRRRRDEIGALVALSSAGRPPLHDSRRRRRLTWTRPLPFSSTFAACSGRLAPHKRWLATTQMSRFSGRRLSTVVRSLAWPFKARPQGVASVARLSLARRFMSVCLCVAGEAAACCFFAACRQHDSETRRDLQSCSSCELPRQVFATRNVRCELPCNDEKRRLKQVSLALHRHGRRINRRQRPPTRSDSRSAAAANANETSLAASAVDLQRTCLLPTASDVPCEDLIRMPHERLLGVAPLLGEARQADCAEQTITTPLV